MFVCGFVAAAELGDFSEFQCSADLAHKASVYVTCIVCNVYFSEPLRWHLECANL